MGALPQPDGLTSAAAPSSGTRLEVIRSAPQPSTSLNDVRHRHERLPSERRNITPVPIHATRAPSRSSSLFSGMGDVGYTPDMRSVDTEPLDLQPTPASSRQPSLPPAHNVPAHVHQAAAPVSRHDTLPLQNNRGLKRKRSLDSVETRVFNVLVGIWGSNAALRHLAKSKQHASFTPYWVYYTVMVIGQIADLYRPLDPNARITKVQDPEGGSEIEVSAAILERLCSRATDYIQSCQKLRALLLDDNLVNSSPKAVSIRTFLQAIAAGGQPPEGMDLYGDRPKQLRGKGLIEEDLYGLTKAKPRGQS